MNRLRALPWSIVLAVCSASCTFDVSIGTQATAARPASAVPGSGPIDILFVVDNSGSMLDEQKRLGEALWSDDCPIHDLTTAPNALVGADADTEAALLERCGLAQLLAAYDRDFHIGVITTTVNACDNLLPEALGGWERGFRPQRGCLQPVPETGEKVLTRDDPNLALNFVRLLEDLGVYGSPFERGLDAAEIFLGAESWVAPGCEGDRELFLRDDAELLLVFVSDEDDCSHEGSADFVDETSTMCEPDVEFYLRAATDCYTHADALNDVDRYVEVFRRIKRQDRAVRAALIGGVTEIDGEAVGASCVADDSGINTECYESGGLSNATMPGQICSADTADARGGLPCCTADGAHRYAELERALGVQDFSASSICALDYRLDLIEAAVVAQFYD